jgi:beta-N-acetylhexosaminidase
MEAFIRSLGTKEKIGQLIVPPLMADAGEEAFRLAVEQVEEWGAGGFIVFGGEAGGVRSTVEALRERGRIPPFFSADLERGLGQIVVGGTLFPHFMALGASGDEDLAYQQGKLTALEARSVGIHLVFAPVVDLQIEPDNPIIGTRSLGDDAGRVARLARAYARGCREGGCIPTAKHFPGHGETGTDSHVVLPRVDRDLEGLLQRELIPYRSLIEDGLEAVMTAHIAFPALSGLPDLPATLCPRILGEILRRRLGFQGLVVTDALIMAGARAGLGEVDAAVAALRAGVDCLLFPEDPGGLAEGLSTAVCSGKVDEGVIDGALRRILALKAKLGLLGDRDEASVQWLADSPSVPHPEAREKTHEIARRALTLLGRGDDILPLDPAAGDLVFLLLDDDEGPEVGTDFLLECRKRRAEFRFFELSSPFFPGKVEAALRAAREADRVVAALFSEVMAWKGRAALRPELVDILEALRPLRERLAVVNFSSPYHLRQFPWVPGCLCAYSAVPASQVAAAEAIFGEIPIGGRLPVTVPGLYPAGSGIDRMSRV